MAAIETYDGMSYKHSAEASNISTTSFSSYCNSFFLINERRFTTGEDETMVIGRSFICASRAVNGGQLQVGTRAVSEELQRRQSI